MRIPPPRSGGQADPESVTLHFKNGDMERQIHCNTELRPDELEKLRQLQEDAKAPCGRARRGGGDPTRGLSHRRKAHAVVSMGCA